MGQVLKIVALGAGALGVFSGSVAVLLIARGDMNRQGLSQVPLLNSFIEAPEAPEEEEGSEGDPAEADPESDPDEVDENTADETADRSDLPDLFDRPGVFEEGELDRLVAELRQTRTTYREREAAMQQTDRQREFEEREIRDRRRHVESLLEELRLGQAELDRERQRLQQDMVRYDAAEKKNMKLVAEQFENMKPDEAARALTEMEEDEVVKVLAEMAARKSGKIMGAFEPAYAARIAHKMSGIVGDEKKE